MTVGFFDFHQEDRNQGKDSTGDTKKERVGARNPYRRRSAHSLREGTEQSALGARRSALGCLQVSREANASRVLIFIISVSGLYSGQGSK